MLGMQIEVAIVDECCWVGVVCCGCNVGSIRVVMGR